MAVSIAKANYFNLRRRLRRAMRLIGYTPTKERVLLKPNAASAYGHYLLGDYTSPQLLEAFIQTFPDREYLIAEGSAVGMNFSDAARVLGYDRLEKKYPNVRLVDLNREPRVELPWKFGKIGIPEIVLESEYVNCPKMKTHIRCKVTLGMKNQKGLLDEKTKKRFHWINVHEAVRELGSVVSPDLTVVDGIIALEGSGPNSITARQKYMGLVVAGRDVVEVDNACLRLMRIPNEIVEHVPEAEVEIRGEKLRSVRKRFELPKIRDGFFVFANAHYTAGCSGCLESLSGGIRGIFSPSEFPRMPERAAKLARHVFVGRTYVFMGKQNSVPKRKGAMYCVGNCTKKFSEENGLPFFPGCPPDSKTLAGIFDEKI